MASWDKNDDLLSGGFGEPKASEKKSVGGFSAPSETDDQNYIDPLVGAPWGGIEPKQALQRRNAQRRSGNAPWTGIEPDRSLQSLNEPQQFGSAPWAGNDQDRSLQSLTDPQQFGSDGFGNAALSNLAGDVDYYALEWQIRDFPPVPGALHGKCKWLEGENYPVLKCYNRRSFLLFFGTIWSIFSFIGLGMPLVKMLTTGNLAVVGSFTNNTGLPDDVAFILFSSVFIIIGLVCLIIGFRQVFMSTWLTFKGGYLEARHAFFRNGESQRFLIDDCIFKTDSISSENKQNVYRIILHHRRRKQKVFIIHGLKGEVVDRYPEYLGQLLDRCRKSLKEHGIAQ